MARPKTSLARPKPCGIRPGTSGPDIRTSATRLEEENRKLKQLVADLSLDKQMLYVHPPYREKEGCRACHDPSSAQLLMTVRDGLCMSCHVDPADAAPYMHRPAARCPQYAAH